MSCVLLHTQMSLDGFIAGADDDMRWTFEVEEGPDETIDEVVRTTGALLVGRRTQDVEDREQPGFYGGAYRGPFCLEADLIDEILVHVTPVLLGDGVRLFSRPGGAAIRLERTSVRKSGQLTALRFSVRRAGSR